MSAPNPAPWVRRTQAWLRAGLRGIAAHSVVVAILAGALVTGWALFSNAPADAANRIGIVLLHGKLGTPVFDANGHEDHGAIGATLVSALEEAGYLVATPEMCWSHHHAFDAAFPDCLKTIDDAVAQLKSRGAGSIVIAGFSLGGNAAIGYAATHKGLAGIIGLDPADDPRVKAKRPEIAASIAKARALVAAGKGDQKDYFDCVNAGTPTPIRFKIYTSSSIYLSFYDPERHADIPDNVAKLSAPLLWIAGSDDPTQRGGRGFAFDRVPGNRLNRYEMVPADHLGTPDAATADVLAWLQDLAAQRPPQLVQTPHGIPASPKRG